MTTEMKNAEAIQMMNRCRQEILQLRAIIDKIGPKAEAYDNLVTVLQLLPKPSVGMGEDMIWVLDKRIRELTETPPKSAEG
jgi:hypothetical protein